MQRLPQTIVILSEVRRSVATEREWKDLLSSAPTRLRQGSSPLHTNIINVHHEPMPMSRMLRCRFSLHVLSIFQSALNVSRCFSTLARGLRIEPLSSRSCS